MELGAAAQTKKPTSVVLIQKPGKEDTKGLEKFNKLFEKVSSVNQYV
jgi:H/ACA ribonucleoprotein complex subunit 2